MSQSSYFCTHWAEGLSAVPKGGLEEGDGAKFKPYKPSWELHGTTRAELGHPAAVVSDLLGWQICPPSPVDTEPLDHQAQGPAAITPTWDRGLWFGIELLAPAWRRKVSDGVRIAELRLHLCVFMAEVPQGPLKHLPSIQRSFGRARPPRLRFRVLSCSL